MTRIDGYVSKKTIRLWLENYESLAIGDRFPDAASSFTDPNAQDGKSDERLNKIVLDQAIKQLNNYRRTYGILYGRGTW
ncbi:TPA: hypothetical protein ACSC8Z_002564 [Bacillus paranthracis]